MLFFSIEISTHMLKENYFHLWTMKGKYRNVHLKEHVFKLKKYTSIIRGILNFFYQLYISICNILADLILNEISKETSSETNSNY